MEKLRELIPVFYSPVSCMYHYLHMSEGNFRKYLGGEDVSLKKYFYALRPVLACRWIERDRKRNRPVIPGAWSEGCGLGHARRDLGLFRG